MVPPLLIMAEAVVAGNDNLKGNLKGGAAEASAASHHHMQHSVLDDIMRQTHCQAQAQQAQAQQTATRAPTAAHGYRPQPQPQPQHRRLTEPPYSASAAQVR